MRLIPITFSRPIPYDKRKFSRLNDEDYEYFSKWDWGYSKSGYAKRTETVGGKQRLIILHREICKTPAHLETDHINGDKLDNRRENLRTCTTAQNQHNRGKRADNKSGYKGVSWHKSSNGWRAAIRIDGIKIHLGIFAVREDAARTYDEAAKKYHGEFAKLNFCIPAAAPASEEKE